MNISDESIIKSSIYYIWDNLGKVIKMSLIWGICALICIFCIPGTISIALAYFFLLPSLTGIAYASSIILNKKIFSYKNILIGAKKFYLRSLLFYFMIYLFMFMSAASYWQYSKAKTLFNLSLFIIQCFFFLIILISQVYTIPLMIDKDIKFSEAFKKSFKMFADNPVYSIKSFLVLFIILFVCFIAIATIPLFLAGVFGMLSMIVYYFTATKSQSRR